ncbi:MAG TPA: chemotaxis-specific protein-glutamate methyltransferase CheB [Rhodanobacteraceae bacterium]|nr:chemotaxis-specific protein-glutamate methyltransferase CheB [Rhodanobacteraceae bacterium]
MIRVLVVEDSAVVREFLVAALGSDPGIEVIGAVEDGADALAAVQRLRPDVITMDIHMPRLDGLAATRRIMETAPTPILIVSGSGDSDEVMTSFDAMEAGALAVVPRPAGLGHPAHEGEVRALVRKVKAMAEVRLVRRWPRRAAAPPSAPAVAAQSTTRASRTVKIVALGASTGGPPVLHAVLKALPANFPVPVVIVQHIAAGFVQGLAEWLAHSSALEVRVAARGELLEAGHAYLAPDDQHMTVAVGGRIVLDRGPPENGLRPSVSCLFRSLLDSYGSATVAALLSGMGRDGASELRLLREAGAVTIAQDKATSVVHGMPGEAIRLDGASLVLPADRMADALIALAQGRAVRGDTP